jgi:hypothetical protein
MLKQVFPVLYGVQVQTERLAIACHDVHSSMGGYLLLSAECMLLNMPK